MEEFKPLAIILTNQFEKLFNIKYLHDYKLFQFLYAILDKKKKEINQKGFIAFVRSLIQEQDVNELMLQLNVKDLEDVKTRLIKT